MDNNSELSVSQGQCYLGGIGQGYLGKGCVYTRSTLLHIRLRGQITRGTGRGQIRLDQVRTVSSRAGPYIKGTVV